MIIQVLLFGVLLGFVIGRVYSMHLAQRRYRLLKDRWSAAERFAALEIWEAVNREKPGA
jgi:hypothetical protein